MAVFFSAPHPCISDLLKGICHWFHPPLSVNVQEIVPRGAVSTVRELFVPESKEAEVKKEAEALPAVEITKVRRRLQLLPVFPFKRGNFFLMP